MSTSEPSMIEGVSPPRAKRGGAVIFTLVVYGIALAAAAALVLVGNGTFGQPRREAFVTAGLTGLFFILTIGPAGLVVAMWSSTAATVKLNAAIRKLTDTVRILSEQAALSDDARRVLNRTAEREMLRRSIEQDILTSDWEAALVLCRELADRFGYRTDAEEFRARIDKGRAATLGTALRDGIGSVDGLILQRRFDDASREAARLGRLYPEEPKISALGIRVSDARLLFKNDLQRRFLEAARGERVDEAMALLKELDPLLSGEEAAALRETAKSVVARQRENLGSLFKMAVEDQEWAQAVTVGKRIMAEFPNSKMALEVRTMMDELLARANSAPAANAATNGAGTGGSAGA